VPELPEIEVLRISLHNLVTGSKIEKVKVNNKNLRFKLPRLFEKKLTNNIITKISRRSKYIIFSLNNNSNLLLHLGMSGIIFLVRNNDKKKIKTSFYYDLNILPKHNHVLIYLNNGYSLVYNDVRRFGFFKIFNKNNIKKSFLISKLGPEPLGKFFNYQYFIKSIFGKKKNIKNLLMDQTFVAGLGNIYVNEILFLSRIYPLKLCNKLSLKNIKTLIYFIKKVLKLSIKLGGSSIRNYINPLGQSGLYQKVFNVYGRQKLKCTRKECSGTIKKIMISKRSSFYCNICQN